jgi:DNA invertase Pin-like site-specific DNA recombinase
VKRVPIALSHTENGAKLRPMIGAVIYVRVSTKEQTENLSLPTQLRACEEYCRRQGYEILERFHEEGESAKTTDRSQLQALLKYCRAHKGEVHFVVVYNLTRFAREKYDHFKLRALLKSLGISLRSATEPIDDTSTGKLMEGVLAAFAQFDNDVRSDRTRAGMRAALELGRWTFPAPLGYLNAPKCSGASLVHDSERGPLVRRAFEDLATGRYTKQEVIARVTEAGLRSRKGLRLSSQTFGQMVRNPIYIGKVESPTTVSQCRATSSRSSMRPRSIARRPFSTAVLSWPVRGRGTIRTSPCEDSSVAKCVAGPSRVVGPRAAPAITRTTTASANAARSTSASRRSKAHSSTSWRFYSRRPATCGWSRTACGACCRRPSLLSTRTPSAHGPAAR